MRVAFSLAFPFYMGRRRSNSRRRGLRSQGEGGNGANGKSGKEEKAHRPSSSSPFRKKKNRPPSTRSRLRDSPPPPLPTLFGGGVLSRLWCQAPTPPPPLDKSERRESFLPSFGFGGSFEEERGLSAEAVFFFPLDWRYDPEAKEKTGLAVARQGPFLLLLLFHHNSCGGLGLVFVLGTSLLWQVLIRRRQGRTEEGNEDGRRTRRPTCDVWTYRHTR